MNKGNKGFVNLGNTCYMNSALQCLSHLDILHPTNKELQKDINSSSNDDFEITIKWFELQKQMWNDEPGPINTTEFLRKFIQKCQKGNIYFESFMQNDVSEFLIIFMDMLHNEISREVSISHSGKPQNTMDQLQIKSIDTWSRFFNNHYSSLIKNCYCQILSITNCPECNYTTTNHDPLMIISLTLEDEYTNIYDCLDEYTKTYQLDGDNEWRCDRCKNLVQSKKTNQFWNLSPIIVILIKQYDTLMKKTNKIDFPLLLDMDDYCLNYKNNSLNYSLQGMCIQNGGLGGGHYYAICKNDLDNKYRIYNDTNVRDISEEDVLNEMPYCLFYKRV
jgi:ubiquitin carboxyl-terminal hydrolase 2/21